MSYIVFDLEFNQDFSSLQNYTLQTPRYPFEVIQIGAIKLDSNFQTVATFNRYIQPTFYKSLNTFITELTGITNDQLLNEAPFPVVYDAFNAFIDDPNAVFCIWGMSDIKELFRNANYHGLSTSLLPRNFINIQPYVSRFLHLPSKRLLSLEHAITALDIPITEPFHNAYYDAFYTSEVFKKVYTSAILPHVYDPSYKPTPPRQTKKRVDFEKLLGQFEKMYGREMTSEEQALIKLAYHMGKTHQFLV